MGYESDQLLAEINKRMLVQIKKDLGDLKRSDSDYLAVEENATRKEAKRWADSIERMFRPL